MRQLAIQLARNVHINSKIWYVDENRNQKPL